MAAASIAWVVRSIILFLLDRKIMNTKMAAIRIDANEWNNWRSKIFLFLIFLSKQRERDQAD